MRRTGCLAVFGLLALAPGILEHYKAAFGSTALQPHNGLEDVCHPTTTSRSSPC